MKRIFQKWWKRGDKCFTISNYSKPWRENNIRPFFSLRTNGASKKKGDKCFSASLTIGYIDINYINFNLQGVKWWK